MAAWAFCFGDRLRRHRTALLSAGGLRGFLFPPYDNEGARKGRPSRSEAIPGYGGTSR